MAKNDDRGSPNVQVSIGGNVSGKVNVAGRDLKISQGAMDAAVMEKMFDLLLQKLVTLTSACPEDIADARENVQAIKAEASKGSQADENAVTRRQGLAWPSRKSPKRRVPIPACRKVYTARNTP